ncbi:hypothetical protein P9112_005243 [Eukaryota sp. TZLM1-RC]
MWMTKPQNPPTHQEIRQRIHTPLTLPYRDLKEAKDDLKQRTDPRAVAVKELLAHFCKGKVCVLHQVSELCPHLHPPSFERNDANQMVARLQERLPVLVFDHHSRDSSLSLVVPASTNDLLKCIATLYRQKNPQKGSRGSYNCSNCGQTGHTKNRCPLLGQPIPNTPNQPPPTPTEPPKKQKAQESQSQS